MGCKPANAGPGEYLCARELATLMGGMVAGVAHGSVCFLGFSDVSLSQARLQEAGRSLALPVREGAHPLHDELQHQLDDYFNRRTRGFDIPLSYPGTGFQRKVWKALLGIPYGETRSYAQVAAAAGSPAACRAVGNANGCNRIAILIPCHRVINSGGGLGGYSGGLDRKRYLLDLELGL